MVLYFFNLDFCYIDPVHSSSSSSSSPSPSPSFACLPFLLSFLSDSRKSFLSNFKSLHTYNPPKVPWYLVYLTRTVPDAKKHPTSHQASPPEKGGNKPFSSPNIICILSTSSTLFLSFPFFLLPYVYQLISPHSFRRLLSSVTKSLLTIYYFQPLPFIQSSPFLPT